MGWKLRRVRELYGRLREGARVHLKAVRLFGEAPEKPVARLFREAVSGARLTRNQGRYLKDALKKLKKNYVLVEKVSKDLSAADILSMVFNGLGLKPETPTMLTDARVRELLDASKGKSGLVVVSSEQLRRHPMLAKDAFGLRLTVDKPTFERLVSRWQKLGLMQKGQVGGVTLPLLMSETTAKQPEKVALTIVPEEMSAKRREEILEHEKTHRESTALGLKRESIGPPKTRQEIRDFVMVSLQKEFVSYIRQRNPEGLLQYLEGFLTQNEHLVRTSMANREVREILDALDLIKKQALERIPADELIAIIRTTPILQLRRRLEGILKHT